MLWVLKRLGINVPSETKMPFYPSEGTNGPLSRVCALTLVSRKSTWVSPPPLSLFPDGCLAPEASKKEGISCLPWYQTENLVVHHGTSAHQARGSSPWSSSVKSNIL